MSWEGYNRLLCEAGHQSTIDGYDFSHDGKCHCGKEIAWWDQIDLTNGSFDEDGVTRIDGYFELTVKEPAVICKCATCSNQHVSREATYLFPEEGKGHRGKFSNNPYG
jgi:hypothetical protein